MAKPRKQQSKTYEPKVKVLETPFADMKVGQRMAIGTPDILRQLIATLPKGRVISLKELRQLLAQHLNAEVACPVTTSMYLRIAVEAAFATSKRQTLAQEFPFWRAIEAKSPLFKKLDTMVQDYILKMQTEEHRARASA